MQPRGSPVTCLKKVDWNSLACPLWQMALLFGFDPIGHGQWPKMAHASWWCFHFRTLRMLNHPAANVIRVYKGGEAGSQTVQIRKQTKQTAGRINIETTPAGAGVFTRNRGNHLASRIGTVDFSPGNLVNWHSWMLNIWCLSMIEFSEIWS